jgi:hypothetical protein
MRHAARSEPSPADLIALVDELIAAYVTWRRMCSALTRSYGLLSACGRRHGDAVFGIYLAALAREEQAATTYRSVLEQITTLETELRACPPRHNLSGPPGPVGIVAWSARSIAQRLCEAAVKPSARPRLDVADLRPLVE